MQKMNKEDEVVIYKDVDGKTKVDVKLHEETAWLSLNQLANLFERDKSVISRHIKNILTEEELEQTTTVAKFATVQIEGDKHVERQIDYYNLDMIISVGYRVNSKRAIEFRRWATGVLKDYLLKGYSINHKKIMEKELEELKSTVLLLSNTLVNQNLVNETGIELLSLIKSYTKTWDILVKYDAGRLELPKFKDLKELNQLKYESAKKAIDNLREALSGIGEATQLFGLERENGLKGIIGNLYQTFASEDLYPTLEEKAAHLIYFVIKDHPFSDGNKRIGCLLFLYFLQLNEIKLTNITPEALTALALLIAESDPKQKELVIKLIVNLLK
jgi:DNA ligase (NAD+)